MIRRLSIAIMYIDQVVKDSFSCALEAALRIINVIIFHVKSLRSGLSALFIDA